MDSDDAVLVDRFVLFFDFLGTSEAAKNWPRERVHAFVDLLVSIAQVQSAEDISGNPQEDGSYLISITPEISTFSDHVVVSYGSLGDVEPPLSIPPKESLELLASRWTRIVCEDSIRILSGVAEMGLRIGLLIRGGLSFGQLYHQGGVVFGEAMIDADNLEAKKANNPRVVVSERVIAKLTHRQPKGMNILLQDTDGKLHLNYFSAMVRRAMFPLPNTIDQSLFWKQAHLGLIRQNIDQLPAGGTEMLSRRAECPSENFASL